MRERPILFNGDMVRAILDGRKTVTRRTMKPQPVLNGNFWELGGAGWSDRISSFTPVPGHSLAERCPFGKPGDRLWVREAWAPGATRTMYRAGCNPSYLPPGGRWKPSIHMPRWASRILLEVTAVRVERLHDITDEQCIAEGCRGGHGSIPGYRYNATLQEHFRHVWESAGGDYFVNPWVWVIEFKRVEAAHA